ncbi:MAG: TPM domain-containing protein [Bdellovibrionota bacterium]|nr:methanol dehydrogenase [Pseudobdellovibrionaceae bacterium]|tara:strand:- start:5390 stop:6148 length:759 start_codon:yes stop_codon:yes gene_type:complete
MLVSKNLLSLLIISLFCSLGLAQTTYDVKKNIPSYRAPVTDQVGWLSNKQQNHLNQKLDRLYKETGLQLAVYITQSLEGEVLEQYSLAVAETWKLGKADSDRGLLLLIAAQDRKIRIEVGQGLEGEIPDAIAKSIIDRIITPAFKQKKYAAGIDQALSYVIEGVEPNFQVGKVLSYRNKKQKEKSLFGMLFNLIFWVLFIFAFARGRGSGPLMLAMLLGGSGGRGGRGGFGGGGFSGGGGGGFSGGGASGGW